MHLPQRLVDALLEVPVEAQADLVRLDVPRDGRGKAAGPRGLERLAGLEGARRVGPAHVGRAVLAGRRRDREIVDPVVELVQFVARLSYLFRRDAPPPVVREGDLGRGGGHWWVVRVGSHFLWFRSEGFSLLRGNAFVGGKKTKVMLAFNGFGGEARVTRVVGNGSRRSRKTQRRRLFFYYFFFVQRRRREEMLVAAAAVVVVVDEKKKMVKNVNNK